MRRLRVIPLTLLAPLLGSCAIGAYFTPITPLERTVNGLYEGEGRGLTGRVPYRLTLTIQEKQGRANGVLSNLESKKVYTGSGTFRKVGDGAQIQMEFFENGDSHRAALDVQWQGDQLSGTLRTVLLGKELLPYSINMKKVPSDLADNR